MAETESWLVGNDRWVSGNYGRVASEITAFDLPVIGPCPRRSKGATCASGPTPVVPSAGSGHTVSQRRCHCRRADPTVPIPLRLSAAQPTPWTMPGPTNQ